MNYQLSQDGKTIKGMPEMEKPIRENYNMGFGNNQAHIYHKDVAKYNEHIASLPVFNCHPSLSEKYEPGAVLVEGKDFIIADFHTCDHNFHDNCSCKNDQVAFPIAVREDDVWEGVWKGIVDILYDGFSSAPNEATLIINYLKQHYTLTPKQ